VKSVIFALAMYFILWGLSDNNLSFFESVITIMVASVYHKIMIESKST
jgi:hypothetical protein